MIIFRDFAGVRAWMRCTGCRVRSMIPVATSVRDGFTAAAFGSD
jgi:hypothetical protein